MRLRPKKNINTNGRILRFAFAIGLLIYAAVEKSWFAGACSIFVFFESFMSWCVVYQILGKNSCPISKEKK